MYVYIYIYIALYADEPEKSEPLTKVKLGIGMVRTYSMYVDVYLKSALQLLISRYG